MCNLYQTLIAIPCIDLATIAGNTARTTAEYLAHLDFVDQTEGLSGDFVAVWMSPARLHCFATLPRTGLSCGDPIVVTWAEAPTDAMKDADRARRNKEAWYDLAGIDPLGAQALLVGCMATTRRTRKVPHGTRVRILAVGEQTAWQGRGMEPAIRVQAETAPGVFTTVTLSSWNALDVEYPLAHVSQERAASRCIYLAQLD